MNKEIKILKEVPDCFFFENSILLNNNEGQRMPWNQVEDYKKYFKTTESSCTEIIVDENLDESDKFPYFRITFSD